MPRVSGGASGTMMLVPDRHVLVEIGGGGGDLAGRDRPRPASDGSTGQAEIAGIPGDTVLSSRIVRVVGQIADRGSVGPFVTMSRRAAGRSRSVSLRHIGVGLRRPLPDLLHDLSGLALLDELRIAQPLGR